MVLTKSIILKHYKRRDFQEEIITHSRDKEVGTRFNTFFGKRPDILNYPREVFELSLRNLTSLHASEERWSNPLALSSDLKRKELDELRIGWDLILDIDCPFIEYSKICGNLIVQFLEFMGVKDVSCKFSGNKGFHIGVPFEAFPKTIGEKETVKNFPEFPKKIAFYIKENIQDELGRQIMSLEGSFGKIKEKVGLSEEEIVRYETDAMGARIPHLNVDKFLEIDTVLISSRHLYRMPYSLHEKSGLVSLPIDPHKIMEFEKSMARSENILSPMFVFLDREVTGESATRLLKQSLDYSAKYEEKEEEKKQREYADVKLDNPIEGLYFPPCMKLALDPLGDGKKRAMFVLMNFLGKVGWSKPQVEKYLREWNNKHPEPLKEGYIRSQMVHFYPGGKLPPNCDNVAYYPDLALCKPDGICKRIKNPVNYTMIRWRRHLKDLEEENEKETRKEKRALERKKLKEKKKKKELEEKESEDDSLENTKEKEVTTKNEKPVTKTANLT